jgi:hypothetical protein
MGIDLNYFEKRVRSLEQALNRLQTDLEDAHGIANRIVSEYQLWRESERPTKELMYGRLQELIDRGRPRCVYAKTLILEYGVSRTKAYQLVHEYLAKHQVMREPALEESLCEPAYPHVQ